MKLRLAGKVAIVTGASKGIGAGIAKGLAAEGAAVAVNYATSKEGADQVVETIKENGGNAIAVQGFVGNTEDVKRLFGETKKAFGGVDILVNNAGIFNFGPIEGITVEEFESKYKTNVLGAILTIQEALKYFPKSGGSIVNISSVASQSPRPYSGLYASTKAAVDTLTSAFAKELAPRNIRVNAVAPGHTETEGAHSLGIFGTDMEKKMIMETPLGRFGKPEDISAVVVFLASDEAAWLTGERIRASGGLN